MNKTNADPKKWQLYESALIKSIRRGLVDDAVYWCSLLCKLGRDDTVWRRLQIHLSEDVGLADRNLPANVAALKSNYDVLKTRMAYISYEGETAWVLPVVHAVMLVASAQKSRVVDHATIVHFLGDEVREVPDYCIDYHSPKGRREGRGVDHFFNEAAKIENESAEIEDIWRDRACVILKKVRE